MAEIHFNGGDLIYRQTDFDHGWNTPNYNNPVWTPPPPAPTPYNNPTPVPYVPAPNNISKLNTDEGSLYIFCDIDGVVADNSHRMHYIEKIPKDYDSFYSDLELAKDTVIEMGKMLLSSLTYSNDSEIVFITGRRKSCYDATCSWIDNELLIDDYQLVMRDDGDFRPAGQMKAEAIRRIIKEHVLAGDSFIFIDDDPLNCLEVKRVNPNVQVLTFGTGRF